MSNNKPSKNFLEALMKFVNELETGPQISDETRRRALMKISDMVDLDLVNALNQWLRSQRDVEKPFTNGQVCSSISYWLALSITESLLHDKLPQSQICTLTELYGDYIHQVSHAIYEGESKK